MSLSMDIEYCSKNPRFLNGYRLVYLPDHPSCMTNDNWLGYVYEHIVVAEARLGRRLKDDEVVHHLNGDRMYNLSHNLLVLQRSQHGILHVWLSSGAPGIERLRENGENSENASFTADFNSELHYCKVCSLILQSGQDLYCSTFCRALHNRKTTRPSKEQLVMDVESMPMTKVGRKYGVSDNSIRKWLKSYGVNKPTVSRATSTLVEGAETSGEVQSS